MTFEESKMNSRDLQNDLRRAQHELRKPSRTALPHPGAPRTAAQAKMMLSPRREHHFRYPPWASSEPILGPSPPAPPVTLLQLRKDPVPFTPPPCLPARRTPRGRRIRDGLRPLPPTPKRNLGFQLRSTLLGPRLVELSEEPRWVESNASRVENGT